MHMIPCPFCGLRPETEFRFIAELGKVRPDTLAAISDADWAAYLFDQENKKGRVREVWMHLPCAELFVLERDSQTMAIIGSTELRKGAA